MDYPKRYATIDIGTNTILMLIAEPDESGFKVIRDEHSLARMGEGMGDGSQRIIPEAFERASHILERYKNLCNELKVTEIFTVATSAMRDAENREEIKNSFETILESEIEIISGEREAKYSFLGAVEDDKDSIVIDIGGGSTEIVLGNLSEIKQRRSLQIGAVRLTEKFFKLHPPSLENIESAKVLIHESLNEIQIFERPENVYAVAGTPTTLAGISLNLKEFDRDYIHGYKLELKEIQRIFDTFCEMSIKEIINVYKVNPARADVITAGSLILISVLEHIKSIYCIASTKGLRYGMMKSLISK